MVDLEKNSLDGTLLSELLEDKDDEFKAKILNLVTLHGVSKDDPLFHFLITCDYLQVLLEEAPISLEQQFENQKQLLNHASDVAVKKAISENNKTIRDSVKQIIKKTDNIQMQKPLFLLNGALLFFAIFCIGCASGIAMTLGLRQLESSGLKVATKEEALDLAWAQSEEGRFARNLYEWNRAYIQSGNCENDLRSQGVSLQLGGNTIKEGICALFIKPPPN